MATASIADKLAKLETKITKREKTIADETKELEKLRDGSVSEKDSDSSISEKGGMIKGASADTARHSFPHTFTEGHEAEQKKGDNI